MNKNQQQHFAQTLMRGDDIEKKDGDEFGDKMLEKQDRTMKVIFQNICHLSESKSTSKSNQFVEFVVNNQVNVMLMAEVGLHWDKVVAEDQ